MTFGERQTGGPTGRDVVLLLVSSAGLAACLTMVFLGMRAVMDIGGSCADGGPFVPVQPCPEGVVVLLLLGIFGLFGFGIVGLYAGLKIGGAWVTLPLLAWPGLFLSLAWNFVEYGFWPPGGGGWEWGWLIPGVLFVFMGGVPVVIALTTRRETRYRDDGASGASTFGLGSLAGSRVRISYGGVPASGAGSAASSGSGGGLVDRLERLASLRRSGDLTDEEFDTAKAALLAGSPGAGDVS